MKLFNLIRISGIEDGTFGVLLDDNIPFCLTLERQWLSNRKSESCIPSGEYICQRITSAHFGETFEVMDVKNRSAILFHKGNLLADTHGCIILGEQFESLDGKNAVLASGKAFDEFMKRAEGENEIKFSIMWAF